MNKHTLNDAGYRYGYYAGDKQHVLIEKDSDKKELWFANKNHASYGIIYKNTHLEFASSVQIPPPIHRIHT